MNSAYKLFFPCSLIFLFILITETATAQYIRQKPKNIIIMICEGAGENHIKLTDYYLGTNQPYRTFPVKYFMSTYPAKSFPMNSPSGLTWYVGYNPQDAWLDFSYAKGYFTDPAAAASAIATGYKVPNRFVSTSVDSLPLMLITERAKELRKSVGIVSSIQWSAPEPAAFSTHNIQSTNTSQIARDIILDSKIDVIMGAGHPSYDNDGNLVRTPNYDNVGGQLLWNGLTSGSINYNVTSSSNNSIVQDCNGDGFRDPWTFIQTKSQFQNLMTGTTPARVCGTACVQSTLQQQRSTNDKSSSSSSQYECAAAYPFNNSVPSLYEMTMGAINVLDNNNKGFLLVVNGGAVAWASYAGQTDRIVEEMIDFDNSVNGVINWVNANSNWNETLLIVTGAFEAGYITGNDTSNNSPITNPILDRGAGSLPKVRFNYNKPTNLLIPMYAKGQGSELFKHYADESDPIRGYFINNSEIGRVCFELWQSPVAQYNVPKNVILIIGDGMGENHIKVSNGYSGVTQQPYEAFPVKLFADTYPASYSSYPDIGFAATGYNPWLAWNNFDYLNSSYTESSAAATALSTGVKAFNNSIAISVFGDTLFTLSERAKQLGKSTGVVTSVSFPGATTAVFGAHNTVRWNLSQITRQMLLDSKLDVIMGTGHPFYDESGVLVSSPNYTYLCDSVTWSNLKSGRLVYDTAAPSGNRTVQDCNSDGIRDPWTLIESRSQFQGLITGNPPTRICGIARNVSTLQEDRSGNLNAAPYSVPLNDSVPTLSEMALGALNVLHNNPAGFFLEIEGGAIDLAAHANSKGRLIEEMVGFNEAVNSVISWVNQNSNWDETLVIVTGDHETGYITGPYYHNNSPISNPVLNYGQGIVPNFRFNSMEHTNSLIPVYAKGKGAQVLNLYADETDPIRGKYLNNSEIAQAIFNLWSPVIELTSYRYKTCDSTPIQIGNNINIMGGSGKYLYSWGQTGNLNHYDTLFVNFNKPYALNDVNTTYTFILTVNDSVTNVKNSCKIYVDVSSRIKPVLTSFIRTKIYKSNNLSNLCSVTGGVSPYTFTWKDNSGNIIENPSTYYAPLGYGRYSVVVKDKNDCESHPLYTYILSTYARENDDFSDNDEKTDNILFTYPNPADDYLKAELPLVETETVHLQVIDLAGKVVKSDVFDTDFIDFTIDLRDLASGTYILALNTRDISIKKLFIKQ